MSRLTFLFILIFFLACAPARIPRGKSYRRPSRTSTISYTIRKGDSLWKIAKQYNVSIEKIMRANKISSPYSLQVGQKIRIPRYARAKVSGLAWPIQGNIVNYFNETVDNSLNRGVNIRATASDRKAKASAIGRVVFSNSLKGWGKTIILKHDSNLYTVYANLDKVLISQGKTATKGEAIGIIGSDKNGNHILHFEVRKRNIPEDPLIYLN